MADTFPSDTAPGRPFQSRTFELTTGDREVALDITERCADFLTEVAAGRDGLLNVFVPHATAGVAVLETGAGSDDDLLAALRDLLPADDRWRHRHGSPGHGRDHVVPGLVAPHATIPVIEGRMALGVWQSVVLIDTNGDNPRRTVRLSFLG
ncbi:YjbQ family protein [Kitasatospora sp. LaBMicrA B282]|uniref:YjbQ family protein n=1 Tax=Kitasatospora sp. LaBMicrA B282 TaxID=3420949 RepID=UPI003D0EBE0A